MDKTYINMLLWAVVGIALGAVVYVALMQPAPAPSPGNLTNITPVSGLTEVNVTLITAPDCTRCDSADLLLAQLRNVTDSYNLTMGTVTTLPGDSQEASALISRYDIEKLPTLVVSPSAASNPAFLSVWESNVGTRETDGSLVFRELMLPYYDVESRTVVGLVNGIAIGASGCPECADPAIYLSFLESDSVGMVFSNKTVLAETDGQAQELITRYNITSLPTFILSRDALAYDFFSEQMANFSTQESDGWFVFRDVLPPYVDLQRNHSVRGLVEALLVVNSSCTACFSISQLSDYIVQSGGIYVVNTTSYEANSSEGMLLISRYNITHIPTVLYSPEASVYPSFEKVWLNENSTVESDGWYVFRSHALLGNVTYQNVTG